MPAHVHDGIRLHGPNAPEDTYAIEAHVSKHASDGFSPLVLKASIYTIPLLGAGPIDASQLHVLSITVDNLRTFGREWQLGSARLGSQTPQRRPERRKS